MSSVKKLIPSKLRKPTFVGMSFSTYYLLLGSNMGDPAKMLMRARIALEKEQIQITTASDIYQTAAWGNTEQSDFLNQALVVKCPYNSQALLQRTSNIELALGRTRMEKWGPRLIDIDILAGPEIIRSPELTLPHPELANRRFALTPLQQIAPDLVIPGTGKTVTWLLNHCADPSAVTRHQE